MPKIAAYALLLLLIGLYALPASVSAYSYGDPNKEDVAETFKAVLAGAAAGDWTTVSDVHKVRRAEIVSHFGESVAEVLDRDIAAKDEKLTVSDYKALMIMNLNRRFASVKTDINDYTQAKLLLAKARATYDALKPYLDGKLDTAEAADLEARFEAALKAIGNPGLFGVGQEAADPELLSDNVDTIYEKIAPLFPFSGGEPEQGGSEAEGAAHAPMAHASRTNTGVTISVIAGVVVLGAAAAIWAKRKGLF